MGAASKAIRADVLQVSEFDFELPPDLIAKAPAEPRDAARLLVYDRKRGEIRHSRVGALPELLRAGDLLVVNDTRVMAHRFVGRRATGGRVECLLLERDGARGRGFLKPAAKLGLGESIELEGGALVLRPERALGGGRFEFELQPAGAEPLDQCIDRVGRAPLPPYLRRDAATEDVAADRRRYQTVFAAEPGAVAAPTAGLHFTEGLLDRCAARGIELARVTLHVGEGTFAPVRCERVDQHRMHAETYRLGEAAADAVAACRRRGGRVVAVGSTATRTLETCAADGGAVRPGSGASDLFLVPGSRFRVVDVMLTNFHLPRSTLLMLVAAFIGVDAMRRLYRAAIDDRYRFYSFGDACLLL